METATTQISMVGIWGGLTDHLRTASTGTLGVDIITGEITKYNVVSLSIIFNNSKFMSVTDSNHFPFLDLTRYII